MLSDLLKFLFERLIGPLPSEDQKRHFRAAFYDLLSQIARASAEGAIKGLTHKSLLLVFGATLAFSSNVSAHEHRYQAQVVQVIDGDTLEADLEIGFGFYLKGERFRLARIDAPELKGRSKLQGMAAKDYLTHLLEGQTVLIETQQKDKYGRHIAEVYLTQDGKRVAVSDLLVEAGHAIYRKY